jgi:PHP domain-containing protein
MAALAAAIAVSIVLTLPPARVPLAAGDDGTIPGILHVHTNRSDGLGTPEQVAAAAARAGLKFVVFTDHGDATRTPDPPAYRSGVLCLDGVEISTSDGHYAVFDMPAAPYPLAGESRDVVDDVRRLGGFGIVAHPDSPKSELAWTDWATPFDAIELLNPDTSWRRLAANPGWTPRRRLFAALLH